MIAGARSSLNLYFGFTELDFTLLSILADKDRRGGAAASRQD